ncbi:MAG: hypothetical protein AABY22_08460 [Nanoarchaeota archaeon]
MTKLKELVIQEANNLKKYAAKIEIERLDFEILNPSSYSKCIYGQLTGDCFSQRAENLIKSCCTKIYKNSYTVGSLSNLKEIHDDIETIKRDMFYNSHWSPIEVFIYKPANQKNGNNEQLVKFIKGEIPELKFK